jgi:hypothetical protein
MVHDMLPPCPRSFVVLHLASERGAALNGRRCVVTARSGRRLAVRMLDDGSTFSLQQFNLMPEGEATAYTPSNGPGVHEADLKRFLAAAAASHDSDHADPTTSERADIRARMRYVREHLARRRVPPPPRCGDMLLARGEVEGHDMLSVLAAARPCCQGDGTVDFR